MAIHGVLTKLPGRNGVNAILFEERNPTEFNASSWNRELCCTEHLRETGMQTHTQTRLHCPHIFMLVFSPVSAFQGTEQTHNPAHRVTDTSNTAYIGIKIRIFDREGKNHGLLCAWIDARVTWRGAGAFSLIRICSGKSTRIDLNW